MELGCNGSREGQEQKKGKGMLKLTLEQMRKGFQSKETLPYRKDPLASLSHIWNMYLQHRDP